MIRHGESETNRDGRWTGWIDASLTEKGEKDAQKAGELLSKVTFDKVYASDLIRARRTAEIALPGYNCELTDAIREVDVGNIAGKPLNVVTEEDRNRIHEYGYAAFGGESSEAFGRRVKEFMQMLEEHRCENIAVFTHAGFLREAFETVLGIKVPRKNICCRNCTVAIFEYSDNSWKVHSWINLY